MARISSISVTSSLRVGIDSLREPGASGVGLTFHSGLFVVGMVGMEERRDGCGRGMTTDDGSPLS